MKQKVLQHIKTALANLPVVVLEKPKESGFGHFAAPLGFMLAKELKRPPNLIAVEIAMKLFDEQLFEKVDAVSGYINFKLSDVFLDEHATAALRAGFDFAKPEEPKNEKILLEFVSANPTGPLHIGHARGAIYGDALLRLGRYLGHDIASEYYINDAGRQVYLLGLSLYLKGREEILGKEVAYPDEYYRGEYISELAELAAGELGKAIFEDEVNITRLSSWGKDKMMEEIRSNLAAVGISFDSFVSEKEQFKKWQSTKAKLEQNSALYTDSEGKIWLKSTEYKDEKDRVVVRENGEATYLAGDIVYHEDKFERGFDRYINIWGADHHGYISRVKASIAFLGYDQGKLEVLLSQMVALLKGGEPYKMSKRAGNFILMKDVVEDIGSDALRFVFLSKKADTHLEFDVDMLNKEDSSNPIFYINYAHARINSVFTKAEKKLSDIIDTKLNGLDEEAKELLFFAMTLNEVIADAFASRDAQKVTEYLKNLAAKFHSFYNSNKVIGSEKEDEFLKIFAVVALSIKTALKLLGIEAKERM